MRTKVTSRWKLFLYMVLTFLDASTKKAPAKKEESSSEESSDEEEKPKAVSAKKGN